MGRDNLDAFQIRSIDDLYKWVALYLNNRGVELSLEVTQLCVTTPETIALHNMHVGALSEFTRMREALNNIKNFND